MYLHSLSLDLDSRILALSKSVASITSDPKDALAEVGLSWLVNDVMVPMRRKKTLTSGIMNDARFRVLEYIENKKKTRKQP